jgi:hypothetical protein
MDAKEQGLTIRRLGEGDREASADWYLIRGDGVPDRDFTGDLGFVIEKDGQRAAIGYLIPTGTKMCLFEYFMTNPALPKLVQGRALTFMALAMVEIARELGFAVILGLVPEDNLGLQRFYQKQNALPGKKKLVPFYRRV